MVCLKNAFNCNICIVNSFTRYYRISVSFSVCIEWEELRICTHDTHYANGWNHPTLKAVRRSSKIINLCW